MDVTFTDDIPKIERQGFERSSKYDELLNACVENAGKAAKMTVDSQGAASSRATSIKNAAEHHESEKDGDGVFIVATRSGEGDEFHIFTKFVEAGTEEFDDEMESRQKRAEAAKKRKATKRSKASSNGDDSEEATEEAAPKPKAKKKARRKAS